MLRVMNPLPFMAMMAVSLCPLVPPSEAQEVSPSHHVHYRSEDAGLPEPKLSRVHGKKDADALELIHAFLSQTQRDQDSVVISGNLTVAGMSEKTKPVQLYLQGKNQARLDIQEQSVTLSTACHEGRCTSDHTSHGSMATDVVEAGLLRACGTQLLSLVLDPQNTVTSGGTVTINGQSLALVTITRWPSESSNAAGAVRSSVDALSLYFDPAQKLLLKVIHIKQGSSTDSKLTFKHVETYGDYRKVGEHGLVPFSYDESYDGHVGMSIRLDKVEMTSSKTQEFFNVAR